MGVVPDLGVNVPEDNLQGMRWYEMAAAQGHMDARIHLRVLQQQ